MKYRHLTWRIKELIDLYENGKINLAPRYQRNSVWTIGDQELLIDTILAVQPLPNFFLKINGEEGYYEMVDGQQRSRAILAFYRGRLFNTEGAGISKHKEFMEYELSITVIDEVSDDESIEMFYAKVNKSGKHLNKPELAKAMYFDTKFLALIQELANSKEFVELGLFRSTIRMNDIDLVSELLTLLNFGPSEKKLKVIDLYEEDISDELETTLKTKFLKIVEVLLGWNSIFPFNKTRYKQKNDMYTIFSLVSEYIDKPDVLSAIYEWLLVYNQYISPSNDLCFPFKEYAYNCVTQSNSMKARTRRLELIDQMLFPIVDNDVTKALMKFFDLKESDIIEIEGKQMFNPSLIGKD